jgi:peptidyl-Asp metalloendopeptidase
VNGVATLKLNKPWGGKYAVEARYAGNAAYDPSTSATKANLTVAFEDVVDVMVAYTPPARDEIGSDTAIKAVIKKAVAEMNAGFRNSLIPAAVRLVHIHAVAYEDSLDLGLDLDRITDPNDGFLDGVHALREDYGADLVSLWVGDGDLGGIAWSFVPGADDNAENGFSVVLAGQGDAPTYTFAHELGHNLGADHDEQNLSGELSYEYGRGHRFRGGDGVLYHDIMSYDPGKPIPYFSNPNVNYKGKPTGKAGYADAARAIRTSVREVSQYEATEVTGPRKAVATLKGPASVAAGQAATFTATVRSSALPNLIATGLVALLEGDEVLDVGYLDDGVLLGLRATGLTAGTHALRLFYGGDENYAAVSSQDFTLKVG